jgi:hypothetical protein
VVEVVVLVEVEARQQAATAALVLSSSRFQIRIAQSLPEQLLVTTLATLLPLTTHNPLHQ